MEAERLAGAIEAGSDDTEVEEEAEVCGLLIRLPMIKMLTWTPS
jgi:hypothetical protein